MSYLVLARKYRPQTFGEIVGQEHVTRTIANAITQARVHHAFLFCGARGVGKTTAARILAKCLCCEQAPTPTPCGTCDACREITAGSAVDVQEIDGASNNSVEDVRTLREGVRYLPVRAKRKVYIIDEVHMLSSGAFNALLKTLEEPPPHAVFIFATTEAHKIPVTILSRVQRYDFRLVPAQRIAAHLERVLTDENVACDPGALTVIAREAAGSVRDALSLLEQVVAAAAEPDRPISAQIAAEALGVADRTLVGKLGQAILARDATEVLSLVAAACDRSADVRQLGHALLEHLRDLLIARTVDDRSALASLIESTDEELAALKAIASSARGGLLELLFNRFARTVDEIARAPLPRYVLEVGLLELLHVEPLQPIGDLLDRLEQLEARPSGGASGGSSPNPPSSRPSPARPRGEPSTASGSGASRSSPATTAAVASDPIVAAAQPRGARIGDWQTLAQHLFDRSPRFAIFLQGKEVLFQPPRIAVTFSNGYEAEQARERLLDALPHLHALFGATASLEIREGEASVVPSVIEAVALRAAEDRAERKREALEHPARKLIVDRFGSDVVFRDPEVE